MEGGRPIRHTVDRFTEQNGSSIGGRPPGGGFSRLGVGYRPRRTLDSSPASATSLVGQDRLIGDEREQEFRMPSPVSACVAAR